MRITVFTSNQPRHLELIRKLQFVCDDLYVVQEMKTHFPSGRINQSGGEERILCGYFDKMQAAEQRIFPDSNGVKKATYVVALNMGELSLMPLERIKEVLRSDLYIVFGASLIKGRLLSFLMERGAFNIHMGVAPYYRGTACNFWALYDGAPELVGATIHQLAAGLDAGPILYHAMPTAECVDGFTLGMLAVNAAIVSIEKMLETKEIHQLALTQQDSNYLVRHSRSRDFSARIVYEYLGRSIGTYSVDLASKGDATKNRLVRPYYVAQML